MIRMSIVNYEFDRDRYQDDGAIFPDEIELDPELLFHGTSNAASSTIEREGLQSGRKPITQSDAAKVADVFRLMDWSGRKISGLPVLQTYTLRHDFRDGPESPIFLAALASGALWFATRNWAGGEKCSAVRNAIRDLDAYYHDASIRSEHLRNPALRFQLHETHPASISVDLHWLKTKLEELAPLKERCEQPWRDFTGGVVYAVRLTRDERNGLEDARGMGLNSRTPIPLERLVARVLIPRRNTD